MALFRLPVQQWAQPNADLHWRKGLLLLLRLVRSICSRFSSRGSPWSNKAFRAGNVCRHGLKGTRRARAGCSVSRHPSPLPTAAATGKEEKPKRHQLPLPSAPSPPPLLRQWPPQPPQQ